MFFIIEANPYFCNQKYAKLPRAASESRPEVLFCFLVVCVTCLRLQTYSTSREPKIELHPDSSRAPGPPSAPIKIQNIQLRLLGFGVKKACGFLQGRKRDGAEAGSTNLSPDKYG